jgi:hypothetical protein
MPKRRRDLHRVHHAWFSGQVHAVHEPAAGFAAFFGRGSDVWPRDSRLAAVHAGVAQQGASLEDSCEGLSVSRGAKRGIYLLGHAG